MVLNRYPLWKNLLVVIVVVISFFYAAPNLYGEDPAVQISGSSVATPVGDTTINTVNQVLQKDQIHVKSIEQDEHNLLIRFASTDDQLKAKEAIQETLGKDYLVAINLAPATPELAESH